ncbi:MAG: hypothetical protein P1U56_06685 [Saprospiraceae bacterium]|nr:hypothetical protein [Saprospiraceae bacterium]
MRKNSFKELEEVELEEISMKTENIRNGISSDIGMMRYVSSVMELYFPKIIDLLVALAGGSPGQGDETKRNQNKYPDM